MNMSIIPEKKVGKWLVSGPEKNIFSQQNHRWHIDLPHYKIIFNQHFSTNKCLSIRFSMYQILTF